MTVFLEASSVTRALRVKHIPNGTQVYRHTRISRYIQTINKNNCILSKQNMLDISDLSRSTCVLQKHMIELYLIASTRKVNTSMSREFRLFFIHLRPERIIGITKLSTYVIYMDITFRS